MRASMLFLAALMCAASPVALAQTGRTLHSEYDQLQVTSVVTITRLSSMANASSSTEANIFGAEDDEDLAALHLKVSANANALAALSAEGLTVASVFAIRTLADGTVTLYVNDL